MPNPDRRGRPEKSSVCVPLGGPRSESIALACEWRLKCTVRVQFANRLHLSELSDERSSIQGEYGGVSLGVKGVDISPLLR